MVEEEPQLRAQPLVCFPLQLEAPVLEGATVVSVTGMAPLMVSDIELKDDKSNPSGKTTEPF